MVMLITESNDFSNYKEIVKNAIFAAKRDGYDQFVYVDSNGEYGIIRSAYGEPVRKLFDDEKIVGKVRVIYRNGIRDAVYVTERPARESIVFEAYQNAVSERNKKALKKSVDIINRYIDDEAVYLPDVLDRNSETYWQIKDYVGSDWNLDAEEIIRDWEADKALNHEYDLNPDGWDPRLYIHNILTQVIGYSYEDADRLLNL